MRHASSSIAPLLQSPTRDESSTPIALNDRIIEFERIGIMNDFLSMPYANGASFASQFLTSAFRARGHRVTVIGPRNPRALPERLPADHIGLPALPVRNHPGVYLPVPSRQALRAAADKRFDVVLAQSASELNSLGLWLRNRHNICFLSVNTVHLPSIYDVLLTERLHENRLVNAVLAERVIPWLERVSAETYNRGDGLIVLARGLRDYWRARGVTAPIHVIPRSVNEHIARAPHMPDPFPKSAMPGTRLLVVCRHTREKGIARLLKIFAREVVPAVREPVTLTLVGDGPDHDRFKQLAARLGIADRTFFPGEYPVQDVAAWYQHADVFVYTSLSETYGQVASEAMWWGLPIVAFADDKGISHQVEQGTNGVLVQPGPDEEQADRQLGAAIVRVLLEHESRRALSENAMRGTRTVADPVVCLNRYYEAFGQAREHLRAHPGKMTTADTTRLMCRWTFIHSLIAALALVRPPQILNRHGRVQPGWEAELPLASVERVGEQLERQMRKFA